MFWFDKKTLQEIIVIPTVFSTSKQELVKNLFHKKTKQSIAFSSGLYYLLKGYEIFFIQTILDACGDNKSLIEKKINNALSPDLFYQDGHILNLKGSFGVTELIEYDGNYYIKKTPKEGNENFSREYQIMSRLSIDSPDCFAKVFKDEKDEDSFLIEVAQNSLSNYINSSSSISLQESFSIIYQILDAVLVLHNFGIVHRDLHPDNILFFSSSNKWKLIDFGLSFSINDGLCFGERHNGCYGHTDFISPQQKKNFDQACFQNDIYSIGRLINFIMCHKPKRFNHTLREIAVKCCSIDKKHRYNHVLEIIADLNIIFPRHNL